MSKKNKIFLIVFLVIIILSISARYIGIYIIDKKFEKDMEELNETVEYKGDKTKEVTEYMLLYIDNTYTDENKVLEYAKYLIKANNNEITDDEASKLVSDAKTLADSKKTANNSKGISVGFFKGEAHTEIQVMRLYK